jgi:hypothetical protein
MNPRRFEKVTIIGPSRIKRNREQSGPPLVAGTGAVLESWHIGPEALQRPG